MRDNIARFPDASDEEVQASGVGAATTWCCGAQRLISARSASGRLSQRRERQRIARPRRVRPAQLLVLDEPNSNLDTTARSPCCRLTELKKAGCTIVIVTHRPSLLGAVDMIAIMREGTLDKLGERDAVLRELGVRLCRAAPGASRNTRVTP